MAKIRKSDEFIASAVNRESRQEVLQTHRFSFKVDLKYPIFFDFKRDTLFFADEATLKQFDECIKVVGPEKRARRLYDNLRHVMVVMGDAHLDSSTDHILGQMLKLKSMRIVVSAFCRRSISSMGLESESKLHEQFLQAHWSHNGADVFPPVTLNSVTEDEETGELVVGGRQTFVLPTLHWLISN